MHEPILAWDTSSTRGGVALVDGETLLDAIDLEEGLRHGRSLLPTAQQLLRKHGLSARDLAAVACGIGPGSYTGVRIGVMAAKSLAFGAQIRLVGISSLAALAWDVRERAPVIVPVQDARRDEVYCGVYAGDPFAALEPDRAVIPEEAATRGQGVDRFLVGSAVAKYEDLFRARAPEGTELSAEPSAPSAVAVAQLAQQRLAAGATDDVMQLQPVYPRRDNDPTPLSRI